MILYRASHWLLFFLFLILISSSSCKQIVDSQPKISLKDSIIKEYLNSFKDYQELTYQQEYDTTNANYKVLRAYFNNDEKYLIEKMNDIQFYKDRKTEVHIYDSCIHQLSLEKLNVYYAYRFKYTQSFSCNVINVTISKKNDSINLHFILYQSPTYNECNCHIIKEYNKQLTQKNWDDFYSSIMKADFWGLKTSNENDGYDGDVIQVWGYKIGNPNESPKYSYVWRCLMAQSTLNEPFRLLIKLSGNENKLLW